MQYKMTSYGYSLYKVMPKNYAPIIDDKDFDITKLTFTEVDFKSDRTPMQGIAFPGYYYSSGQSSTLVFKTGPICLVQYGIPKLSPKWIKDDRDREYIKVPYDLTQPSCVSLFSMLKSIDDYMG